jgi:hypothetical protein
MSGSKLDEIMAKLNKPLMLSDLEKAQFHEMFTGLGEWLTATEKNVFGMERTEAYRFIEVLTDQLKQVESIYAGNGGDLIKVKPDEPEVEKVPPTPEPKRGKRQSVNLNPPTAPPLSNKKIPPQKRVTEGEFRNWFNSLSDKEQSIARRSLDCVKNFFNDKSADKVGPICVKCNLKALKQCIRNEDPSFENADTVFVSKQLEGAPE